MSHPQNLSRSELIKHMQGKPRSQVVETALALHASADTRSAGDIKVPLTTAIAMAELASPNERRRLRKESPDLFERTPSSLDLEAGRRAIWAIYQSINLAERGGAEKRKDLRNRYLKAFQ